MIEVPEEFAESLARWEGEPAKAWLAALPDLAEKYCDLWELKPEGEPLHGFVGLVHPVRRADGTTAMLKLSWPGEESRYEWLALSTWDGDGAVKLLDHSANDGVLLLEKLDADHTLDDVDIDEAVTIAAGLLRRLAKPAPEQITTLAGESLRWEQELADEKRLPRFFVDAAISVCRDLGPQSGRLLVNQDLHYENVLRGQREPWLVIDPKPLAADPEFGLIPLLWNRFDADRIDARLSRIVEVADLDADRARAWTLVSAVVNWIWALDTEGEEDLAVCCAAIAEVMARP